MSNQSSLALDVPGASAERGDDGGRGRARKVTAGDERARMRAEFAYMATFCDKMALRYPEQRARWLARAADYRLQARGESTVFREELRAA